MTLNAVKLESALYIVATPIGNLQDISVRALDILRHVDKIAAEDTRHSQALLQHYAITTPLVSLHQHNERQRADLILQAIEQGASYALISDAGTPLISDPGHWLCRQALQQGIKVVPIPGPCALISALSVAGVNAARFIFEGFLPPKSHARQQVLQALAEETRSLVFYEAPHRIQASLTAMLAAFGEQRYAVLARELTKRFETIKAAPLVELLAWVTHTEHQQKGEFVVIVEGAAAVATALGQHEHFVLKTLLAELPLKQAVKLAAQLTSCSKNELYQIALNAKGE